MRWTEPDKQISSPRTFAFLLAALLVLLCVNGLHSADEKIVTIYAPGKAFSVPVAEHDRTEYIDLIAVLNPLGKLEVKQDGRKWKLRINDNEAQFQEGKNKSKVRGHDFVLPQRFFSEQGKMLIPLSSLPSFLQSLLRVPVRFHPAARRLFLENVTNPFSAQFVSSATPKLVFNFSAAVSPTIANEPGKMHIVFTRDAVVATGPDALTFRDNPIRSSVYEEKNGNAEITIQATTPLLATFSNGGKTLTVSPAPSVSAATPAPIAPVVPVVPSIPSAGNIGATAPIARLPQHRFLVVVDPSHGGDERGAALSDTLAEKDVTLALGRSLRQELQNRGIEVLLLRDGDSTVTTDQRATLANTNRAALYLTLHAGSVGNGVRLYTCLIPADAQAGHGDFIPWELAQAGYLNTSRSMAAALASEIQARQIEVRVLSASLPPLNHVAALAIAVEMAPRAGSDVNDLTSVIYQQTIASALAAGIASAHSRMEAVR